MPPKLGLILIFFKKSDLCNIQALIVVQKVGFETKNFRTEEHEEHEEHRYRTSDLPHFMHEEHVQTQKTYKNEVHEVHKVQGGFGGHFNPGRSYLKNGPEN